MFFSKEADKFLNAVNKGGMRSSEHGHKERDSRGHYAEGGDVEDHKRGMRVHRKHRDDGGEVEQKKRGKRVHARSHHADVSDVEPHARGGRTTRPGFEVEALINPDKAKHHRKCHAEGGDVDEHRRGKRVRHMQGNLVNPVPSATAFMNSPTNFKKGKRVGHCKGS